MALSGRTELTSSEQDAIAWDFLGSEFAERNYAIWPIDRRIDAYLRHHGLDNVLNDGAAYDALLQRVMANIGSAMRRGLIGPHQN